MTLCLITSVLPFVYVWERYKIHEKQAFNKKDMKSCGLKTE